MVCRVVEGIGVLGRLIRRGGGRAFYVRFVERVLGRFEDVGRGGGGRAYETLKVHLRGAKSVALSVELLHSLVEPERTHV